MARSFDGTDDRINWGNITNITGASALSFSCWAWENNLTQDHCIFSFETAGAGGLALYNDDVGSVSGRTDMFKVFYEESPGAGASFTQIEGATNSAQLSTWQHLFCSAIPATTGGLQLWIGGVEDANSPVNTTNLADMGGSSGPVEFGEYGGGKDRNGYLAECAFWNRILTDPEIVILSKGYSPFFIPNGLIFYSPLIGNYSPEIDIRAGNTGTLTGTATIAHPRIIYPSFAQIRRFTTAVPAAEFLSRLNLMGVG